MKNEHKFKVGDRVTYHAKIAGNPTLNGKSGTVIYVDGTRCPYTVEFDAFFDENNGITDLRARIHGFDPKPYHGWFCREENLSLEVPT